jgi:FAD/FMN-containing dehydrogenase/Fe-S oxidoreductase
MQRDDQGGELAAALRRAVGGEVDFGGGRRAEYSSDASLYRCVPLGVVFPRDAGDVEATLATCRQAGVPLTFRGGGTSIGGQAVGNGVVVDCSRHLDRIVEVDPERRLARVQPGVVLDDLRRAAAAHGLDFGPDPSTHSRCTLGGMIGNNSCGSHSVAWGRTAENVAALELLLDDGTRMTAGPTTAEAAGRAIAAGGRAGELHAALRSLVADGGATIRRELGRFPRQVSGYALEHLLPERGVDLGRALVGSEGTCAVVLEATVALIEPPAARGLVLVGFDDLPAAADEAPAILERAPLACEGIDFEILDTVRRRGGSVPALPDGRAWLYVEVGGAEPVEARAGAERLAGELASRPGVRGTLAVADPRAQRALWRIREDGAGLATRLPDGREAWPGWEDAAVPPERFGDYLRGFRALLDRHGRHGVLYGHFGEGCVHVRIDFDLQAEGGPARYRAFVEEAADLVAAHGGSLSGEHGDGRARSELLPRMYGPEAVSLFERFKGIWDPGDLLNPGVLVRPAPVDRDLRPAAPGRSLPVALRYPDDGGDLGLALRRCVGVGKCRAASGGVMCPSFRATRDERDSTRGRARTLQEMLAGGVVADGWRSTAVRDALDLCLSCKGCKRDCPVEVDMATYKSEFLYQHYRRRPRPAAHYALGLLPRWARLASLAPALANRLTAGRRSGAALRRLGGIAPQRPLPRFARRTLRAWWRASMRAGDGGRPGRGSARAAAQRPGQQREVMLWVDTFTEHFTPQVGQAAVEVLEAAGFRVRLPDRPLCCGLTWLSTGQLGGARRRLRRTLDALEPALATGMPLVVLEPSCAAVLRDDVRSLLGDGQRVRRLAGATQTLAELLEDRAPDWRPGPMERRVVVQTHCHQHAVLGSAADDRVLERLGAEAMRLDAGCCGMAGNFGFEAGHYDTSVAVAELALLPALRAEPPGTVVLADGFSCRTQIEQLAGRPAMHLAELLRDALGAGPRRTP